MAGNYIVDKVRKVFQRARRVQSKGTLWRTTPLSRKFGIDRGTPIDRYYIEKFLLRNRADIRGHVLEIAENTYTQKFGGDQVTASDVLHTVAGAKGATIIGDLSTGEGIPDNTFDCMIITQTYQFIYDMQAAVWNTYQSLKPGGIVLATFSGISQISRYDMDRWGEYWRVTTRAVQKLFEEEFYFIDDVPLRDIQVESYGNVLSAISLLHGLAAEELTPEELDYIDPDYQVVVTVRGVKK
jgi:hypothetical protein